MSAPVPRLLGLARPVAGRLAAAGLAGAGAAASAIGLMAASAWLISRAAQHPPVLYLTMAIVAVRAFGISRGGLRYLERLAGHDAAFRVLGMVRARGYERLERIAPVGLHGTRAGDIVARFVSDVDAAVDVLTRVVLPYLAAVLAGLASVALIGALLAPAGAALLVGLAVVAVAVPVVQAVLSRRAQRHTAPLRGALAAQTVELIHGLPDLLAYDAAPPRLAAATRTHQCLRRAESRVSGAIGLGNALVVLAAGTCVWAAAALGSSAVRRGALDGVLLAVVVLTPLAVFDAVAGLPGAAAQFGLARSALSRVFAVIDHPDPVVDPADPAVLPAPPYHLRLEHVTARWGPGLPDAVTHVELDLPPGQRVALVGPSGCGKSTIAALLVRFLDPRLGRVTLNGVDLRRYAADDVRRIVGLVSDDAHAFDTTIEENLRVARPDATDAQLRAALEAVRLSEFVNALPDGLATPVGERGSRLSGGQRRRLALARALLADFPVLILDEPAEHVDEATAAAITADLLAARPGHTLLLITHRPFGIDGVDTVVDLSAHARSRDSTPGRA